LEKDGFFIIKTILLIVRNELFVFLPFLGEQQDSKCNKLF